MKKIYIILLVLVLLSGIGGLTFFLSKKKKEPKMQAPKVPVIEPKTNTSNLNTNKDIETSIPKEPLIKKTLELDIKVPYVDTGNRRFDYSMHYKGIPYKGVFEEGITNEVQVKKSFGSFVLKQRMNQERGAFDIPIKRDISKDQKMRGGTTSKGAAIKVGVTNVVEITSAFSLKSDWVDLFILDAQNNILKQLSVNLRTGETSSTEEIAHY